MHDAEPVRLVDRHRDVAHHRDLVQDPEPQYLGAHRGAMMALPVIDPGPAASNDNAWIRRAFPAGGPSAQPLITIAVASA